MTQTQFALLLFVVALGIMMWYNHLLLKSADKRLKMANEMVLKLASSADKLAESVKDLKGMCVHLEQVYTARNQTLSKNRDEIMDAYKKLLVRHEELQTRFDDLQLSIREKYNTMSDELFHTMQEIARKPTITNN